jgi:hypothetical protein
MLTLVDTRHPRAMIPSENRGDTYLDEIPSVTFRKAFLRYPPLRQPTVYRKPSGSTLDLFR